MPNPRALASNLTLPRGTLTSTEPGWSPRRYSGQLRAAVEEVADTTVGRSDAIARLDGIVRRFVLRDAVLHVKIRDASGRITYSDEQRLKGARYPVDAGELAARGAGTHADLSDLAVSRIGSSAYKQAAPSGGTTVEIQSGEMSAETERNHVI